MRPIEGVFYCCGSLCWCWQHQYCQLNNRSLWPLVQRAQPITPLSYLLRRSRLSRQGGLRELAAVKQPQSQPALTFPGSWFSQLRLTSPRLKQLSFRQSIVRQISPGGLAASIGVSFDGVGLGLAGLGNPPFAVTSTNPDSSGAVGLTQYVQWVNKSIAVFRKTDGLLLVGPVAGNSLVCGPLWGGRAVNLTRATPLFCTISWQIAGL